jgi:hypothetical protein
MYKNICRGSKLSEIDYYMPIQVTLVEDKYYDENNKLPAHDLVIRPLLEKSIYAYAYKGTKEEFYLYGKMQIPINLKNEYILIPEKGKFRFDTTKECIMGHEYLWNARMCKRGSIIMIIKMNDINVFNEIFKNTFNPCFCNNPNTGNTMSAIKKCKEEMEKGNIAICLSQNNGIEWIQIYLNRESTNKLYEIAEKIVK